MDRLRQLHDDFKDRVTFLFIYVTEATHPVSELGSLLAPPVPGTDSPETRRQRIAKGLKVFDLPFPCLVDEDGRVEAAYGGAPQRLVLVGADGLLAHDAGLGRDGLIGPWDLEQVEAHLRIALAGQLH